MRRSSDGGQSTLGRLAGWPPSAPGWMSERRFAGVVRVKAYGSWVRSGSAGPIFAPSSEMYPLTEDLSSES